MARAYLDVTPDLLHQLPAMLPLGVNIFGSKDMGGAIRLVLEGRDLPDGKQLDMIVSQTATSRRYELMEAEDGQVPG